VPVASVDESRLRLLDRDLDSKVFGWLNSISLGYLVVFLPLAGLVGLGFLTWLIQMIMGIGIAGIRRPVFWGFYISNFVFWIGISHSGTLISAILRVLKVEWRRPLTRAAEAMTVFALSVGALFPIIHLGRPWRFYWLLPYPNWRGLWPNFHSPLLWDMLAIFTYVTASLLFLYFPLVPDLAAARDHTHGRIRHRLYGILSLGWRGSQQQWHRLELAMKVFTIVVIPVAVSVHSIVSWDFGMTIQPGWNSTVFAPYFVLGAIYSGTAALITVLIAVRRALGLTDYLTVRHFDRLGKILQAVAVLWFYFFFADFLTHWYSNRPVEKHIEELLVFGSLAPLWWGMLVVNLVIPFVSLWFRRVRTSMAAMLVISLLVNVGMWTERYLIVVGANMRNYLSYNWGTYWPRWPEIVITVFTFSMFAFMYVVFSKIVPLISLWEVKEGWRFERWHQEGVHLPETEVPSLAADPNALPERPVPTGGAP